jgi:uncharacterized protein YaeQ
VALTATVRRFDVALSDSDRGVYESLELRAAQHPSESDRYLIARILARCVEHDEGVDFTRGLSADDEPALWQRDLRGDLKAWIEIGSPSALRLHKASKTGARVAVYAFKGVPELVKEIAAHGVHRVDELALYALDGAFLDRVAATLDRVNRWDLAVSGGAIYLTIGGKLFESQLERVAIPTA